MNSYLIITHKSTGMQVITQPGIEQARGYVINHCDHSTGCYYISPMINERGLELYRAAIKEYCHNTRIDKEVITIDSVITGCGINKLYTGWVIAVLHEIYTRYLHKHYNRTFVNDTYELHPVDNCKKYPVFR